MALYIVNKEKKILCQDDCPQPIIFSDEFSAIHFLQKNVDEFKNKPEWYVRENINFINIQSN